MQSEFTNHRSIDANTTRMPPITKGERQYRKSLHELVLPFYHYPIAFLIPGKAAVVPLHISTRRSERPNERNLVLSVKGSGQYLLSASVTLDPSEDSPRSLSPMSPTNASPTPTQRVKLTLPPGDVSAAGTVNPGVPVVPQTHRTSDVHSPVPSVGSAHHPMRRRGSNAMPPLPQSQSQVKVQVTDDPQEVNLAVAAASSGGRHPSKRARPTGPRLARYLPFSAAEVRSNASTPVKSGAPKPSARKHGARMRSEARPEQDPHRSDSGTAASSTHRLDAESLRPVDADAARGKDPQPRIGHEEREPESFAMTNVAKGKRGAHDST